MLRFFFSVSLTLRLHISSTLFHQLFQQFSSSPHIFNVYLDCVMSVMRKCGWYSLMPCEYSLSESRTLRTHIEFRTVRFSTKNESVFISFVMLGMSFSFTRWSLFWTDTIIAIAFLPLNEPGMERKAVFWIVDNSSCHESLFSLVTKGIERMWVAMCVLRKFTLAIFWDHLCENNAFRSLVAAWITFWSTVICHQTRASMIALQYQLSHIHTHTHSTHKATGMKFFNISYGSQSQTQTQHTHSTA